MRAPWPRTYGLFLYGPLRHGCGIHAVRPGTDGARVTGVYSSIARARGGFDPRRARDQAARSMREVAPVVLEDETDRGEHGEQQPDQEQPPSDREADRGRGRGQTH